MRGNPVVEACGDPGESGSHEQGANGTPYGVAGAERRSDGGVAADDLAAVAHPLNGSSTLIRGEAEVGEVQTLPRGHSRGTIPDNPAVQEPGRCGAEPAVSVKDENRQGRSHLGSRPGVDESLARVLEQHRQGLRLPDDRQEVRVAAPPRDDVLVQVGTDASPGNRTLVDANVVAHR